MNEYQIKYNKLFPIIIIASSTFILASSFIIGFSINTLLGFLLLALGILMLLRPAAVITKDEIELRSIFGMTLKRYPYSKSNISFKNKNLYIKDKKIISSFNASINKEEITSFIKSINSPITTKKRA
jgi:hypothetical protein